MIPYDTINEQSFLQSRIAYLLRTNCDVIHVIDFYVHGIIANFLVTPLSTYLLSLEQYHYHHHQDPIIQVERKCKDRKQC